MGRKMLTATSESAGTTNSTLSLIASAPCGMVTDEFPVNVTARFDPMLRHGLRGRQSNRKTSEAVKQRAVEPYRQKKQAKLWHDYGPTLAVEELARSMGSRLAARAYASG
jgi:hypothetical protein